MVVFARVLRCQIRIFIFLLCASISWAWGEPAQSNSPESVVAVADVHGDFDDLVAILQRVGIIDARHHWTGGNTTLVQVGDLLDRGPKPREVMDLMMSLEKEAPQAGGRVISLLGNHEMMNIMGDLRYVTAASYASFADANSEERRKSAYQEYVKWRGTHAQVLAELPQPLELTEAEWMARHPAGYIEQREAFGPNGLYGKWLRDHQALICIGAVLFVHGGIDPDLANKMTLEAINTQIRDEIRTFDDIKQYLENERIIVPFFDLREITDVVQAEITAEAKAKISHDAKRQTKLMELLGFGEWLSVRVDGPLWFRGYNQWSEEEGSARMGGILQAFQATHIVAGHQVQPGGHIRPRFGGKVIMIDTGMLASYYTGGRASALQIQRGAKFTADYMDQQELLFPPEGKEKE